MPETDAPALTRRAMTQAALAAGFALAVQPISAATIVTDSDGIDAGDTSFASGRDKVPVYYARPKGKTKAPVLLVVHEVFGVHEHIKDVCRRFAKLGYFAVAPDLFARQGDATKIADINTLVTTIVSKVWDQQVTADLDAAVAWAAAEGGDTGRLAITGFCWGGRVVWMYAEESKQLKAGVAFYGRLTGESRPPMNMHQPIDTVDRLNCPVLGFYGGKDQGIPVADVDKMREAAKAAGKPVELVVYDDAQHGFFADYRPSYNEADAKDALAKMLAFLKANGAAP